MGGLSGASSPFTYDPAATAAFARLKAKWDEDFLHDTAAPVRAVVIGGGTGAPVSIRTLLTLECDVSAVVAMADDGGSTGILREEAGVLPPGDIRKCLVAMAAHDDDPLVQAFKCRFAFARNHTLGNLMLSALEDVMGSLPEAIALCGRLLAARGHVYPSTLEHVRLCAETYDNTRISGQAAACKSRTALRHVRLESDDGPICAYGPALEAIRQADLIVLGPGSLFTSIIPNLLVPGVEDAIRESQGITVFVCSLADMQGETWGLSAREHYEALVAHGMDGLIDYMLIHSTEALRPFDADANEHTEERVWDSVARFHMEDQFTDSNKAIRPVKISYDDARAIQDCGTVVMVRNLADPLRPTWHNPEALRDAFRAVVRLSRTHLLR